MKRIISWLLVLGLLLGVSGFSPSDAAKKKKKKTAKKIVKIKREVRKPSPTIAPAPSEEEDDEEVSVPEAPKPKIASPAYTWGAGLQTGLTGFGISGKYTINNDWTGQAIFSSWSLLGTSSTFITGRGLYTFNRQYPLQFYGGGEVGYWMFSGAGLSASSIGFGALVGLEYYQLPQFAWNAEAGFRVVTVPTWFGGTSAGMAFGGGFTYYF